MLLASVCAINANHTQRRALRRHQRRRRMLYCCSLCSVYGQIYSMMMVSYTQRQQPHLGWMRMRLYSIYSTHINAYNANEPVHTVYSIACTHFHAALKWFFIMLRACCCSVRSFVRSFARFRVSSREYVRITRTTLPPLHKHACVYVALIYQLTRRGAPSPREWVRIYCARLVLSNWQRATHTHTHSVR